MPAIETIVKARGNRISVPVPKGYGSYSFHVILVPIRPDEPSVPPRAAGLDDKAPSLADALLAAPTPDDNPDLDDLRTDDSPSFFERSGGFASEAFA